MTRSFCRISSGVTIRLLRALIILIYKMSATEIVSFFKFLCLVEQIYTAYDKKQSNQASTFILISDLWLI
jgi:hypothetical protein